MDGVSASGDGSVVVMQKLVKGAAGIGEKPNHASLRRAVLSMEGLSVTERRGTHVC
jgi:hypothetical protein